MRYNNGVQNTGSGSVTITGNSAVGTGNTVNVGAWSRTRPADRGAAVEWRADIGIITVLPAEMSAVASALAEAGSVRERTHEGGFRYREADIGVGRERIRAVLTQADAPGQRPAALAFERMRRAYAPAFVALVGIAGRVHPELRPGDVIVAQEVIYYDARKETPEGTLRRGETRPVPAPARRAINDFFSRNREVPCRASIRHPDGKIRECKVLPGPIGSGEAVVADAGSEIREYVSSFNDKVLGLETEAGGLAEAFHEMAGDPVVSGWLVVRGISDLADAHKDDSYHEVASWHAAVTLLRMLPDLFPDG